MVRGILTKLSWDQSQALTKSTAETYDRVATRMQVTPTSVDLGDGTRGHWMGSPNAKYVLVFFHGKYSTTWLRQMVFARVWECQNIC